MTEKPAAAASDSATASTRWTDPRFWSACAAVTIACYIAQRTLADVLLLYHPLPYWDYWDFIGLLPRYLSSDFSLADLWAQHNEHRILFARLVFLADFLWFGANGALDVACACLIQAGHAALLAGAVVAGIATRGAPRVLAGAAVAGCMLHPAPSINLFWGFQVQFVLVYFAITLALYQLTRPRVGSARLAMAVLSGFVATGSMANGVLVWPLLWSLAVQRRLPVHCILFLVVAGVAMLFGYLHGYSTPSDMPSPLSSLATPLGLLTRLCAALGSPLWFDGIWLCIAAGAVTLLLSLWAVFRRVGHWFRMTSVEALLVHLVLLVLGTCLMMSAGRTHLPLEQMISSRYGTPILVLWSALLGLAFVGYRCRPAGPWRSVITTAFVAGLALLAPLYRSLLLPIHDGQVHTSASLLTGVSDTEMLRATHDVPIEWTLNGAELLRSRRWSVFGSGLQFLIGADLLDHFNLDTRPLTVSGLGKREAVPGDPTASRIDGWTYHSVTRLPPELILVVNGSRHIVGLGFCAEARPDVAAAGHPLRDLRVYWRAWIREPANDQRKLSVYGIWEGTAIPILAGDQDPEAERSLIDDFDRLGPPVTVTGIQASGSWSQNGWPSGAPAPPFSSLALASYSGSDSGTGVLRATFAGLSEGGDLLVPLLTGPVAVAVTVRILDGATGAVQASLQSPQPFPDRWRLWRVALPPRKDGANWVLEAVDRGRGWGQWFALAAPLWQHR